MRKIILKIESLNNQNKIKFMVEKKYFFTSFNII